MEEALLKEQPNEQQVLDNDGRRKVQLQLTPELYRRFKVACARRGLSGQRFAVRVLTAAVEYVEKDNEGGKGK